MLVNYATEGIIDAAVARKLLLDAGLEPGTPYTCGGKDELDLRLSKYNAAAKFGPWFILRDQNSARCASDLVKKLITKPAALLCFRVVPREIEAWLMGDRHSLSKYLSVSEGTIPINPEAIAKPKQKMVWLATRSSRTSIRSEMIPRKNSGISVGPNYGGRLYEFIEHHWNPARAAANCPALSKARTRLRELHAKL